MGTGTIELGKFKKKEIDPGYKERLDGFIQAITPGKPIAGFNDKKKYHERGATFVGLYNIFLSLMRGYSNLTKWEDREAILERVKELRVEASYWTVTSSENYATNIDEIVEKYVPPADIERFNETSEETIFLRKNK